MKFLALAVELHPFEWENIKPTLGILWKGLLAIFVVIGIIIAVVTAVNFIINKVTEKKKARKGPDDGADGDLTR